MKPTVTKVIGTAAGVTLLAPGIALAVPPEAPASLAASMIISVYP